MKLPALPLLALAAALPAALLGACRTSGAVSPADDLRGAEPGAGAGAELAPLAAGEHVFHRRVLANGLHAAAVRDAGEASVFLVVAAGKRHETEETTGLAHLVEHAMYAGTARTPADAHDERIQAIGGESNAFTRQDYTLFYDHGFPAEHLAEVLGMEADRLRGLTFDPDAVLHERERLRVEEAETFQPDSARDELVESLVYRVHPYRAGVYDVDGHTRAPTLGIDATRAFYDRHYWPRNTAVVVVGPRPEAEMLDAVERAFGALPAGPAPPPVPVEPPVERPREHRVASELSRDRCEAVWIVPAMGHPDRPALAVLARVLAQRHGPDGAPVQARVGGRVDRELFRVAGTGADACATVERVLAEARAGEIAEDELRLVKGLVRDEYAALPLRARPYFSLAGAYGVVAALDRTEVLAGWSAAVDAVTVADLARAAREHLAPEARVTVFFEGTGAEPEPLPDDPQALTAVAQEASAAGDLDRAIAAFTRLLELDDSRMSTVINLASRGQVRMEQADWDGAIADFEQALEVVDYPAVRDLLHEAQERKAAGLLRTPRRDAAPEADAGEPGPHGAGAEDAPHGAGAAGTGAEAADERAAIAADLHARVDEARVELETWRGLAFLEPVELELVAEADDEKLAGWYEPETDRLVVVEGKGARFSRGTLLHELFHALQDQHFDLAGLHADAHGPDERMALDALIEGEAMLAVAELMNYDFEQHAVLPETGPIERDRFDKVYRYGAGLRYVRALRDRGGWLAVDGAFADPPRTTAAILHPDREPPEPAALAAPLSAALEGGRVVADERRGELELRWLLVAHEPTRARAAELAAGLAGDRARVVERDGERREQWDLRFADEAAAARFVAEGGDAAVAAGWNLARTGRDVQLVR